MLVAVTHAFIALPVSGIVSIVPLIFSSVPAAAALMATLPEEETTRTANCRTSDSSSVKPVHEISTFGEERGERRRERRSEGLVERRGKGMREREKERKREVTE